MADFTDFELASEDYDEAINIILDKVYEQIFDEDLWCGGETAAEAYLQQALRALHAVIEESLCDLAGGHKVFTHEGK